jgi:putative membrane protein
MTADKMPDTSNPPTGAALDRFAVSVTAPDHFAWLRTRMSLERTLMAWVRTSVSLIGFGFTIVQFLNRIQELPGGQEVPFPQAPLYLGLALISCGIAALIISIWQYRKVLNYLWAGNFAALAGMTKEEMQTPILAVALGLILIGTFAFGSLLFQFV